ncbi:MAG: hypothetical protein K6C10_07740 [Prevotella sp.]|nr:hypothetical protein [Prevotella sp.]
MKKWLTIIIAVGCCLQLQAQNDSLRCPMGVVPQQMYRPYYYGLHQGLNVQLSASVIAGFGKNAPKGAGFAQNLQATYLAPINNKLTLMVGGYVNNLNWGGLSARNAGIYGELSYQFNEHWEAHVYGQKNITGNTTGFIPGLYGGYGSMLYGSLCNPMSPLYGGYMGGVDRLGAGVRYMPNQSMSIEVNVEQVWMPSQPYMPNMGNMHDQVNTFGKTHGMPTQKP